MHVMMPICGRTMWLRGAISPGVFMPISKMARCVVSGIRASVSGTPQWLLKLLALECAGPNAA